MALRLRGNLSPNVFLYHVWPLTARGPMTHTSTKGKRNGGVDNAVAKTSLALRCVKMGSE